MTTTISDQLEVEKAALNNALLNDDDTTDIRVRIADLEQQQSDAESRASADAAKARRQEEAELSAAADDHLKAEKASIERAAHVAGLEELLPDEQAPARASDDPELTRAAHAVAKAQRDFDRAAARYKEAQAKVDPLAKRIRQKSVRRIEIRDARLAGDESKELAIELHAIDLDIESLTSLIESARAVANGLDPAKERATLRETREWLARVRAKATERVLRERTSQAEQLLVQAHKQLVEAALAAGHTNQFTVYDPSSDLKFICYGIR